MDIYYASDDQPYSISEGLVKHESPDLPCSISGFTSISFSIGDYNSVTAPAWVSIDTSSGELTITAPTVSVNTNFSFYINSAITEYKSN